MKKKKTKKLIILILLLLLLIGGIVFVLIKANHDDAVANESSTSFLAQVLDSSQTNVPRDETVYKTSPDIALPGFAELTVKANTTDVHIGDELFNPSDNIFYNCPECGTLLEEYHCPRCDMDIAQDEAETNEYYLKFEIYLDDTNEMIYSSDLVSPGYHIEDITLSRGLNVGDYSATVVIRPYRNDMISECNNGQLNITLHVTDTM